MTHPEQVESLSDFLRDNPRAAVSDSVLEFGSYEVNGSSRHLFPLARRYVGVDWRKGPGVDLVSLFHRITFDQEFDFWLCVNTLEHDPHWRQSLRAGIKALKPGGHFYVSIAGPGYPPHEIACAPLPDYYCNVSDEDLVNEVSQMPEIGWRAIDQRVHPNPPDLVLRGRRASA